MLENHRLRLFMTFALCCAAGGLGGCAGSSGTLGEAPAPAAVPSSTLMEAPVPVAASSGATNAHERECLTRAMYFESNRSSEKGLRAVGTVVMNRVASPKFPDTICGVVGQRGQFASGILSKPMRADQRKRIERIADQLLAGDRETAIGKAMYFHQAGLKFPYRNMRYKLVAGGNAFYEKVSVSRRRAGRAR